MSPLPCATPPCWLLVLATLVNLLTVGSLYATEVDNEGEWWKLSENARGAAVCAGVFRQLGRPADERYYIRLGQASDLYEPYVGLASLRRQLRDGAWDTYLASNLTKTYPELTREVGLAFLEGADDLLRQPRASGDEILRSANALRMIPKVDPSLVPTARAWAIRAARAVLSPRSAPHAKGLVLVLADDRSDPDVTEFLFRSSRDLLDTGALNEAADYAMAAWMGRRDRTPCEMALLLRDVGMAFLAASDESNARLYLSWAVGVDPSLETDDVFWAQHVTLSCRPEVGARDYLDRFPTGSHRARVRTLLAEAREAACTRPFSVLDRSPGLTPPRVIETKPVFVPAGQFTPDRFSRGPRVRVTVDACGVVCAVSATGWPDSRAIDAAWCGRFEPARVDGHPVAATAVVEIPVMELVRTTSTDDRKLYPGMEIPAAVPLESWGDELARMSWKCTTFEQSLFPQPIFSLGSNSDVTATYPSLPDDVMQGLQYPAGTPCIEYSLWKLTVGADGRVESARLHEAHFAGQIATNDAMAAEEKRYGQGVRSLRYTPMSLRGAPVRSRTNLGLVRYCGD